MLFPLLGLHLSVKHLGCLSYVCGTLLGSGDTKIKLELPALVNRVISITVEIDVGY